MKADDQVLLKDPLVREEIMRYKWIESEHAGSDIGWEQAAREWIGRYATTWRKAFPVRKRSVRTKVK